MDYIAHIIPETGKEQSVLEHLEETADLAAGFAAEFGAGEAAFRTGILHDVGKYSEKFQQRIRGAAVFVDHSTAGALEAMKLKDAAAAFCIAGHHGGLPDRGQKGDGPGPDIKTLLGRLKRRPGEEIEDYSAYRSQVKIPAAAIPTRLVSTPDSAFFYTHMLYSSLVDADWLNTERFMSGGKIQRGTGLPLPELMARLEQYVSKWWGTTQPLNRRRCDILRALMDAGERECGLYTLTVPTGGGKTVSSMAFALRHALENEKRRIIYVIPYTSIIEQTQQVFEEAFGAESVVAHYANVTYDNDEGEVNEKRYLAAENWDAPVILTTAVQFFESLFANRSSLCRKLHNIAGSVIIFDEAQMLPVNYLNPCVWAITELVNHYGCSGVLCTATQPSLEPLIQKHMRDEQREIRELCRGTRENYDFFRRVTYKYEGLLSDEELATRLAAENQVLCVVNSRAQARTVFKLLPEAGSFHLSTYMKAEHRKQVLQDVRQRLAAGEICRVVSTSLIEAGVDVDFPTVYRALAGLDSIIQAGGRCNREGKKGIEESIVHIFETEAKIPKGLAQNIAAAQLVIREYADIASPEAIEAYFKFLLYILKGEGALDSKSIMRLIKEDLAFETVAHEFRLIEGAEYTVYVPLDGGEALVAELREKGPSQKLLRRLGAYGVSLRGYEYQSLLEGHAIEPVAQNAAILLDTDLYDEYTGLVVPEAGGRGFTI